MRLLVACLVLLTAACGGSGSASSSSAPTGEITSSTPSAEPTGPESPRPAESGVSVTLPTLPIGGSADDPLAVHQCVSVSWTGSQIIEGATVVVTGIAITPSGLFKIDSGAANCGGPSCAASFSFRPSQTTCFLAVAATHTDNQAAQLTLAGSARCAVAQRQWCDDLPRNSDKTIELVQPTPPTSSPTSSSASTSTPTSASSS